MESKENERIAGRQTALRQYAMATLRWTDRKGACQSRYGNARILATRLEKLRCPATLKLQDGTLIGTCRENLGEHEDRRTKWIWFYDPEMLVVTPKCICLCNSEPQHHQRECPVYIQWKSFQKQALPEGVNP